jgi:hypothetical protein
VPRLFDSRFIAIAALGLLSAAAAAQQRFYCYDDENGRRVCGDSLPPEAARFDREIRNERGVVVGTAQGEVTAEEQRVIDEERRAEEESRRLSEERRRYTQLLLDSYTSVADIEKLRDRMLTQIEGRRR